MTPFLFPLVNATISLVPGIADPGTRVSLQRGVLYRVVSQGGNSVINYKSSPGTIVVRSTNVTMNLEQNQVYEFMFGMADSQGTNLPVWLISSGVGVRVYFTPLIPVP